MNELDFSFDDSPWELYLSGKRRGDSVSAAHFLTLLEQETEEAVEDAFAALEDRGLLLDISGLPGKQYAGQAALRLRQEAEIAENGMDAAALPPTDPLRLYLEEIRRIPLGDQQDLARRYAAGDASAAERLMNLGLHRVVEIVPEFVGYGVLMMDLLQEGGLALWQAIQASAEDYLPRRDAAIRGAMAKAVTLQARANGVGRKMRQALEDYRAVDERLLAELGRNPTLEEIALEMHITPEEADTVRKALEDARMLQQATAPKEEETPEEENQAVEDTAYFRMRQRIEELLSVLPEQDAKLLTLRFGLEKGLPMSPEETGKALGLTVDEVTRREAAALALLRNEK